MPAAYREAQAEMRKSVAEQWKGRPPLEGPISLYLEVHGEGRGDGDNIVGALMDAVGPSKGVPGLLWVDDRVTVISAYSFQWFKAPRSESQWIIKISLLD